MNDNEMHELLLLVTKIFLNAKAFEDTGLTLDEYESLEHKLMELGYLP